MILIDNNFNLVTMFLPNFNSSVEFSVCLGISFSEWSYHMEPSPPICSINLLTCFYLIGDFSVVYSQRDCNFNVTVTDTNVNVTVDSYVNSSFNFSFPKLLKYLIASKIIKLGSTSKIRAQFETIPQ